MTKPYDPSDRAERAAQTVLRNFSRLERKYLTMIGERVKAIGRLKPTDMYRLEVLRDIGGDMAQMKRELAKACGMTMHQLEPMLLEAAQASMRFLDGMGSTAPYQENELAITFAAAQYAQTEARMANLSNTTATAQVYQSLVDDAVFALQTGVTDYQSAIRESLRKAAVAGLQADGIYTDENGTRRIAYASGRTKRLDSAVRQNILDGARQLAQLAMEDVGKQIGCDGVEITAHMECAEDHLPYQGRQYSNEEFQRIQDSLRRRIGQWNCRHFVYPIVLGLSEPAYTPQELEQYRQNSTEQITIGNVTKTRYQWTQEQRRLETAIRREKDCAIAAKAAGDDVLRRECQRRINDYRKHCENVCKQVGLNVRNDKLTVSGFRAVKVDPNLTFIANDARMKATSSLPKVLKGLPDELLQSASDVSFSTVRGVIPAGARIENVCVLAGEGTSTPIKDIKRLYSVYKEYGNADKWQKKAGTVHTKYFRYELHWYENGGIMPPYEVKTKKGKEK